MVSKYIKLKIITSAIFPTNAKHEEIFSRSLRVYVTQVSGNDCKKVILFDHFALSFIGDILFYYAFIDTIFSSLFFRISFSAPLMTWENPFLLYSLGFSQSPKFQMNI